MDLSKFKPGDWLLAVGGVVMLIFGLALDWAKVDFGGVSASGNNAFDYFFTGGLAWLLVVAAGVIAVLLAAGAIAPGSTPWTLILLFATGLAALLMLIRLILGAGDELDRAAGMYVAFIATLISLGGAVLNFTTSGGKLSDLTDVDKMRDAFKGAGAGGGPGSSSSTPPPPPPPPAP